MDPQDRIITFSAELAQIHDPAIRAWVENGMATLPDYFFHVAASSTGKYHPQYAQGDGGLVRHTKAAIWIAVTLFNIKHFNYDQQDIILAALHLHDGLKHGPEYKPFSRHDHPYLMYHHLTVQPFFQEIPQAWEIIEAIITHSGQWNTARNSSVVLPLPQTEIQHFVHQCDYLASRKMIEFNFAAI